MLRFVTAFALVALASGAPPTGNIFKIDISPEEAQQYLANPPFTAPQLSPKTAVLPLVKYDDPRFRSAEAGPTLGHYWKNGKEIENPDDYVEEVYNAAQFHGQDGLGAYVYGYETPESSKIENRVRSGDVTGAYEYKAGRNKLIKVRYWADSQGFHQEDNLPKVELHPVEESPDVRAARLAHEKAWQEAAAAAAVQPDPQYAIKNLPSDYYQQTLKALPANYYQPQAAASAEVRQKRDVNEYQPLYSTTTEPEPTGPPRGFFYSYTYPVSILKLKKELLEEESSSDE